MKLSRYFMVKKFVLFLIFLLVFVFISPESVSAEWCCGHPSYGGAASDPRLCINYERKCFDPIQTSYPKKLRPCNFINNKTADLNGDGIEDTYNSDCFTYVPTPSQFKITNFGKLFSGAVAFLLLIAFILAFVYLILGGIAWLTSGGDKGNIENARNKIIAALIGLVIVASTWAIFQLVGGAIGFNILKGFKIPALY